MFKIDTIVFTGGLYFWQRNFHPINSAIPFYLCNLETNEKERETREEVIFFCTY